MTSLYKEIAKTWASHLSVLIILLKLDLKESGAVKYLEISPNFALKEHYYLKGGGNFNQIGSHSYFNRNPYISCIWKENPAT